MNKNEKLKLWADYRLLPKAYYHLVTDSYDKGQFFNNDRQFAAGMNTVAVSQFLCGIRILTFNLMVNHAHFLVYASGSDIVDFFIMFKRRINAVLVADGFMSLPEHIGFKLFKVDENDPYQLRDLVIYIARNPYKANSRITPSGYLWGSNYLIFSDIRKLIQKRPLSEYSITYKRNVLRTKVMLPDNYYFNDALEIVLPESYVEYELVEKILKSSWAYCGNIVRNMDSYVRIAERIGERIVFNDKELDMIIHSICVDKYGVDSYLKLGPDDRCKLAVALRKKYYIDPKRISRKLGIAPDVIADLFK